MALEDFAGKPESDAEADEVPIGEGGGLMAKKIRALKRMFSAKDKGDWKGVASAFLEAKELCDDYEGEDDEAEDDEDEASTTYEGEDEEA